MIRRAVISDVKKIQELINYYAQQDLMLPRSLNDLYENMRNFIVYEKGSRIYGCSALQVTWEDLAEIRSLAVKYSKRGTGIGKELLFASLDEARALGVKKVFALTYEPEFFKKFGFNEINKSELPHKIWSACINCVKFPDCDEVALMLELE
jgi:amino-acid N-acetyltransferase